MNDSANGAVIPRWVMLLCVAVAFVGVFDRDLWTPDEPRDAAMSLEMSRTGDFVVPHLAGEPFVEKPPLYFAVAAGFVKAFGGIVGNAGAIRLSTVMWGLGTLAMTFLLARRLFGRDCAVLAAVLLATMEGFVENMHWIRVDAALVFFVAAALWAFAEVYVGNRRWFFPVAGLFTAGSFLAKGAIGPLLIAIGWAGLAVPWAMGRVGRKGSFLFVGHIICLISFLLPAICWMYLFWQIGGPALWHEWFWENHFGRLTGTAQVLGHMRKGAPWYYLKTIAVYSLPWFPLVLVWVGRVVGEMRTCGRVAVTPSAASGLNRSCSDACPHASKSESPDEDIRSYTDESVLASERPTPNATKNYAPARIFLLVWTLGSVVVLTLSTTKRDMYLTPMLAGFAIMCADVASASIPRWCRILMGICVGILVVSFAVLVATPVLIPIIKSLFREINLGAMEPFLSGITVRHAVAAICLLTSVGLIMRGKKLAFVPKLAALTALFYIGLLMVGGKAGDLEKSMRTDYEAFASKIPAPERTRIAGWNFSETTRAFFYFYCDWTVPRISDRNRLFDIVAGRDAEYERVIITREPYLGDLLKMPYRVVLEGCKDNRSDDKKLYLIEGDE